MWLTRILNSSMDDLHTQGKQDQFAYMGYSEFPTILSCLHKIQYGDGINCRGKEKESKVRALSGHGLSRQKLLFAALPAVLCAQQFWRLLRGGVLLLFPCTAPHSFSSVCLDWSFCWWVLELLIRVAGKMGSWSLLWPLGVAIIQIINLKTYFIVSIEGVANFCQSQA